MNQSKASIQSLLVQFNVYSQQHGIFHRVGRDLQNRKGHIQQQLDALIGARLQAKTGRSILTIESYHVDDQDPEQLLVTLGVRDHTDEQRLLRLEDLDQYYLTPIEAAVL